MSIASILGEQPSRMCAGGLRLKERGVPLWKIKKMISSGQIVARKLNGELKTFSYPPEDEPMPEIISPKKQKAKSLEGIREQAKRILSATKHCHPAPGTFRKITYENQKGICHYCLEKVSPDRWESDHKKPISKGGKNIEENMIGSCSACNRIKSSMGYVEFLKSDYIRHKRGFI